MRAVEQIWTRSLSVSHTPALSDVPTKAKAVVQSTGPITINRPMEDVFDVVADARIDPRYNPRTLRAEKISDGPIGLGTRLRDETTSFGRSVEILIEITSDERPHQLSTSIRLPATEIQEMLTFDSVRGANLHALVMGR